MGVGALQPSCLPKTLAPPPLWDWAAGPTCGRWLPLGSLGRYREMGLLLSHSPWASRSTVKRLSCLLFQATQMDPAFKMKETGSP